MTYPRDYKQYKRERRYPRVRRDALLGGHEAVNNNLRRRIAGLEEQVTYYRQVCEQRAVTIDKFQKRVAELEASQDRRTQQVVDATLRKMDAL